MANPDNQNYKMSFSTGGLFLNESLELARLRQDLKSWDEALERALNDGVAKLPKTASNRRTLREIINRVSALSTDERFFLVEQADRTDQQALLWLAICRAYRFIREFALEVIRERYLSYEIDISLERFDILFEAKAEWDEGLRGLRRSTRLKLREIMFRMMREAGILSEKNTIQTAILSTSLRTLIESTNPEELLLFPGVSINGAA